MKSRIVALFAFALAALVMASQAAWAADNSAIGTQSFFESVLAYGGWIGWIIIAMSVWTVAVIIEAAVNVRREKICPPELVDELEALMAEEEYQEALELCEAQPNFLTNSLGAALPRINEGWGEMKTAMENTAGFESMKLMQKVGWLYFLSNLAPMLGLFGTVTGMIEAFKDIVRLGSKVTPTDLAAGISAALITTFDGLLVAIPALFAYQYFRNKCTRITVEFGGILESMTEKFRKAS
jgi:biopolymer transport protein ExbB